MIGSANFSQRNYIPPELAYRAWLESGSTTEAVRWLVSKHGLRNPRTNEPPRRMGVWQRACEYILNNLETVKPEIEDSYRKVDKEFTQDNWEDFIVRIAKYNLSYKRFQEFLIKYPEMRIYYEKQKQTTTGS